MHREPGVSLEGLGRALSLSRPTVSDAAESLARKGLLTKRRSLSDPQVMSLELTALGRTEAELAEDWLVELERAIDSLPPKAQADLLQTVDVLLSTLGRTVRDEALPHRSEPAREDGDGSSSGILRGPGAAPAGRARSSPNSQLPDRGLWPQDVGLTE